MFRWALGRIALALVLAIALNAQTQTASDAAYQRAVQLHQAGDLPAAIEAYRQCLAADPSRYDARSNLGAALSASGKYPEAIEQYRQAIEVAPPQLAFRLWQNLGLAYYKSGQYEAAIAALSEVRKDQGPDLKNDLLLADSFLQNGEPERAAELLSSYESNSATDKAVAYVLGTALIRSGHADRGQKVIDVILRDGDSAEARFLLGTSSFAAKDFPEAVKQFAAALALNPTVPGLHSWYGQALLTTGDPSAAAKAFREELDGNPNDFDSNLHLGQILMQRKASDEALPLLERAAAERPQSFEAQMSFARVELQKRDYVSAIANLQKIAGRWPDAAGPHEVLAEALASSGKTGEATRERELAARFHASVTAQDYVGPRPGDTAPGFSLPGLHSAVKTSLDQVRQGSKPLVLLFGSYTCPNFRAQAAAINSLADKYHGAVPFLLVYIREAHTGDTWESTVNQREGIDWRPAKTNSEMQEHATSCVRKLKMNFPAVVDGTDGKVESVYAAWPSRLYVIDGKGLVAYSTGLSELDFHPADVEAAIQKAASHP